MRFEDWIPELAREISEEQLATLLSDEELAEALSEEELGGLLLDEHMLVLLSDGQLSALLTVTHAQQIIRAEHGRGASRWVADQVGIAARTARRWLGPRPPVSRHGHIVDLAMQTASRDSRLAIAATAPLDTRISVAPEAPPHIRIAAAATAPQELRATVAARITTADAAAAAVMRTRRGHVAVGKVEVVYDGRPEGTRDIGAVDITLHPTASALAEGDREEAATLFSTAILEQYGPGLSQVLEIVDYPDGIQLT